MAGQLNNNDNKNKNNNNTDNDTDTDNDNDNDNDNNNNENNNNNNEKNRWAARTGRVGRQQVDVLVGGVALCPKSHEVIRAI